MTAFFFFFLPYSVDPENRQGLMASEVVLSGGDSLHQGLNMYHTTL